MIPPDIFRLFSLFFGYIIPFIFIQTYLLAKSLAKSFTYQNVAKCWDVYIIYCIYSKKLLMLHLSLLRPLPLLASMLL
jgi:hypothetical protein